MTDLRSPDPSKSALRRTARAARKTLSSAHRVAAASAIARHGLAFAGAAAAAGCVSVFQSLQEEIDTGPLIDRLDRDGRRLAFPVTVAPGQPLAFRSWRPGEPLVDGWMGIKEPAPEAARVEPDVVLVPLLAFDASGWRLGYGGGFYDRTLRALRARKAIVAIGLAFDEQRVDAVPHSDYDEPLDWVLTPAGAISCRNSR